MGRQTPPWYGSTLIGVCQSGIGYLELRTAVGHSVAGWNRLGSASRRVGMNEFADDAFLSLLAAAVP